MNEALEKVKAKLAETNAAKLEAAKQAAESENPEAAKKAEEERAKLSPTPAQGHIPAVSISGGEKPALGDMSKLRIFRSRIPGSSFVMREGYTVYFHNGWYETTDASEIQQLDAVANKTPGIHTEEHEQDIIAAIVQARKEGFTGSIVDAMTQQITAEQRIAALRSKGGGAAAGGTLKLPTVFPAGGAPEGLAEGEVANRDAALRQAIRAASAQSNG